MSHEIPRRNGLQTMTKAEVNIFEAMEEVENLPADERLTDAVVLLQKARQRVADYVDGIETYVDGIESTMSRTAADVATRRVVPMQPRPPYGMELVIDMHDCDRTLFNREALTRFFNELCQRIKMSPQDLHFWDYDTPEEKSVQPPHLKGTSAVQFIETSSITLHALDDLGRVYLNIFSCREFHVTTALDVAIEFFGAGWCAHHVFERS